MTETRPETKPDTKDGAQSALPPDPNAARKPLTPAAESALAEAAARRAERERLAPPPAEFSGRGGLDPARYGDWEVKGVASDF